MSRTTAAIARSTACQRALVSELPKSGARHPAVERPPNKGALAPPNTRPRLDEFPDWLTIDEARAVLNIGRSSIYELVRSGTIPSRRFGRLIRIPRKALDWHLDGAPPIKEAP
jgi:excisionase family DNA binding protein